MENYKKISEIPGFENAEDYILSKSGSVYRILNNGEYKQINGSKDSKGYLCLDLRSRKTIKKYPKIHRLVASMYIENPKNLEQVNHIDGNKTNNSVSNLEFVTSKQNRIHAIKNNLVNSIGYGIEQYSLDGELIATYETAEDALIEIGRPINSGNIGRVIRGKRKTAYGYIWKSVGSSTTIETERCNNR